MVLRRLLPSGPGLGLGLSVFGSFPVSVPPSKQVAGKLRGLHVLEPLDTSLSPASVPATPPGLCEEGLAVSGAGLLCRSQ